ncbi:hypothetical protein BELL_0178g00040 [Botrytis elliptica]|uniref:Glycosyl hydrolase family 63 C-terminal domain-containing protein n=1 Tax=Botrytis elliptica TaxID=278938 RepID=A0A4Z1JXP5_9HELO|nr:hypothetical protein EAE99_000516 [Botrytis elliptica]TGO76032.1 hypothetical protein BELL_0178g00040 [Botrytis elliptica]
MMRSQARRVVFVAIIFSATIAYILYTQSKYITWPRTEPNDSIIYETQPNPNSDSKIPADPSSSIPLSDSNDEVKTPPTVEEPSLKENQDKKPDEQHPAEKQPSTGLDTKPLSDTTSKPPPIVPAVTCPSYAQIQRKKQEPLSEGHRKFPYSRPSQECRTFNLPSLEKLIEQMKKIIKDPDLFRLFENSYPNTLDTTIKWRGYANKIDPVTQNETATDEELTFVITGDIDAMWLRDSASQIYSYLPLLEASDNRDSLASLWRGLINLHARYIIISPYCHSFQPPPESGLQLQTNGAYHQNHPMPAYDPDKVFDCKWELDSLASFLQVSSAYYQRTNDLSFFQKYSWIDAVQAAVDAAGAMRLGTYSSEGKVQKSAWTFTGWTNRGSETLTNDGLGNPTKQNGMVRSAFRPSDDACIYQLLVPANMMWAKYLEEASIIMEQLSGEKAAKLTTSMREQAFGIRKAINRDAITRHWKFGDIYAYEIDGFGGHNLMDDANVPSLLAIPLWDYENSSFPLPELFESDREQGGKKTKVDHAKIYNNTRNFVLSQENPYFMQGPSIAAVGGPHLGPGKSWPMAAIIRALTAMETASRSGKGIEDVEKEVVEQVMMVLDSTGGTGVIHESVNSWNANDWTRAWFGWANGLFGELVMRISREDQKAGRGGGGLLGRSWQTDEGVKASN